MLSLSSVYTILYLALKVEAIQCFEMFQLQDSVVYRMYRIITALLIHVVAEVRELNFDLNMSVIK